MISQQGKAFRFPTYRSKDKRPQQRGNENTLPTSGKRYIYIW